MKSIPTKALGELIAIEKGKKAPEVFPSPSRSRVRYLQIDDLRPDAKPKYCEPFNSARASIADVVIAWDGANAGTVSCNLEGQIGSTLALLKPVDPKQLSATFLSRFLQNNLGYLRKTATGATIPHISKGALSALQVPLPPLQVQERLVELLDESDALRKLRAQADRRTADLIPALFHNMFGKDSEWPVEQLENLCNRVTVGHVGPMATEYVEIGVTFLRGQNIKRGWLDLSSVLFVSEEFHRRLEKSAIAPGDVVSVRTGKPGTTAVIPASLKVANCADLIVMTCGPQLDPNFLCELLNQRLGDKDNIAGATGIAQQHFNIGEARRLELALPPLALQKEFAARITKIRALEAEQSTSRYRLDDLFQSMLHRAFYGEL